MPRNMSLSITRQSQLNGQPKHYDGRYLCTDGHPKPVWEQNRLWIHNNVNEIDSGSDGYSCYRCKNCGVEMLIRKHKQQRLQNAP